MVISETLVNPDGVITSVFKDNVVVRSNVTKLKILDTGNLEKSFTGAFFANTVFSMFAKFNQNL